MANLKDFRHRVSVLKKQGLLPSKTQAGRPLDARYADPRWKVKGKSLGSLVNKFDDVSSGKATALKVPQKTLRAYKKAGYETSSGRVIVPHSATEKATVRQGQIVVKSKSGIERVQIPIPFQNLEQYLTDIQKNQRLIDAMKKRGDYFGFKFFGNNSSEIHSNIDSLIEHLRQYSTVQHANTRMKQQEIYRNLEIVRIRKDANWIFPGDRRRLGSKAARAKRQQKFRKRLKRKPAAIKARYRRAAADRQKAYRDRLKGQAKKDYKKKAKKRAKRSRRKTK